MTTLAAAPTWPTGWSGRWIWAGPPPARGGIIGGPKAPPESHHRHAYLRRIVAVGSVPASAPARLTADGRVVFAVNGVEIGRGPARGAPERLAWIDVDLAPHLVEGTNVLTAHVRYYGSHVSWWRPASPTNELGYGSFVFECPALEVRSDSSWRGHPGRYALGPTGASWLAPRPEVFDGTDVEAGWQDVSFDDAGWTPATELAGPPLVADPYAVPGEPFTGLEAEELAPLTAIPLAVGEVAATTFPADTGEDPLVAYRAVRDAGGGEGDEIHRTFDAGGVTIASPWVEVSGPAGSVVDVYVGEDLLANGVVETAPRFYALRYVLIGSDESAPERHEAFDVVGFRYLTVVGRRGAAVHAVGATERRYPTSGDATFECGDDRLEVIWRTGARTLEVCSTDAFLDCPGREQNAWVGDSYVHALLSYVSNGDWRLVRRHLRLCTHGHRADGFLTMIAAQEPSTPLTIPDYSLHWVRAVARYLEHTGDVDTVDELLPTVTRILEAFERYRGPDGLLHALPSWVFVDWAMTERSDVVAAVDALYAAALDDGASMVSSVWGATPLADAMRSRADATRVAFELLWDDLRGVYVDAIHADGSRGHRVSQQTNAVAILSGCAPQERWERILDRVLDEKRLVLTPHGAEVPPKLALRAQWLDPSDHVDFDADESVVMAQPFFSHLVHQAVVAGGRRDLIPALCLRWWDQIERGNTCFEEYWTAPPGTSSRAHAWSATPTYDLTAHVLGVTPAAPGYARVRIAPLDDASLGRLHGRVPTPLGTVSVTVDGDEASIVLPDGCEAEAVLFGEKHALAGGRSHTVRRRT